MSVVQAKMDELRENPGTPFRPPAVAILTIDSRDRVQIDPATGYRIDTTSPYQVLINKQQSVMNGFFTRIAVTEVNMQYNSPNVIDEGPCKNNTLLIEEGNASGPGTVVDSYTVELLEDFYTPNELAKAIQDKLVADLVFGVNTWSVVYIEQNNNFQISTDDALNIRIRPQNIGFNDDLCNLMGFSYPSPQFAERIVGSYASMIYTPYFDIVSDNLTKKQNVRDNGTSFLTGQNLLARVYLVPGPGVNILRERTDPSPPADDADCNILGCRPFSLYREFQSPKQIYWDAQEFINVIDLRLVDYKGRTLYSAPQQGATLVTPTLSQTRCGEAANFQLTLQVTET
jgi:hypothetical protein